MKCVVISASNIAIFRDRVLSRGVRFYLSKDLFPGMSKAWLEKLISVSFSAGSAELKGLAFKLSKDLSVSLSEHRLNITFVLSTGGLLPSDDIFSIARDLRQHFSDALSSVKAAHNLKDAVASPVHLRLPSFLMDRADIGCPGGTLGSGWPARINARFEAAKALNDQCTPMTFALASAGAKGHASPPELHRARVDTPRP